MIENQWYAILPSKRVKTGQIVGVKRLNLELALFRNSKGELGCVVDQCTHRGAALSLGKIKGDCIQCPFHGIIYLWYGDEEKLTSVLPFFNEEIDASFVFSEIEDPWNSHYSRCIENQLDVVHLPFVHHNTIGKGNKTLIHGPKVLWEGGILTTSANNEVDVGQKTKSPDECVIKNTYLRFVFPNVWLNHISEKIKVLIYFAPVDEENTILYIRFYCRITKFKPLNRFIAYTGKFANKTIERQDKRVVITQKPKASALRSGEKLVPGDGPIIMYRKIREALKTGNMP